jgi:hypothetical protein
VYDDENISRRFKFSRNVGRVEKYHIAVEIYDRHIKRSTELSIILFLWTIAIAMDVVDNAVFTAWSTKSIYSHSYELG